MLGVCDQHELEVCQYDFKAFCQYAAHFNRSLKSLLSYQNLCVIFDSFIRFRVSFSIAQTVSVTEDSVRRQADQLRVMRHHEWRSYYVRVLRASLRSR